MAYGRVGVVASFFGLCFLAGCGSSVDDAQSSELTHWLGDTPHFAVSGTFQGKSMNIRLEKDAATAAGVYCKRNYAPLPGNVPDATGKFDESKVYFAMKELGAIVELDGQKRDISFGNWRHNPVAGTSLTVVPRTFGTAVPDGQTWVDIGIIEPGMAPTSGIESAAESGTVTTRPAWSRMKGVDGLASCPPRHRAGLGHDPRCVRARARPILWRARRSRRRGTGGRHECLDHR